MRIRLLAAKALAVGVVGTALVSHHVYSEESAANISMEMTACFLLGAAALGRLWSAVYIAGKKTRVLVTDGPYSLTRNPLYFFSFLGFLGAGLALESLVLTAALAGVFFLTHWPTILKEERKLREAFNGSFDEYTRRVPRFVPRFTRFSKQEQIELPTKILGKVLLETSMVLGVYVLANLSEWFQVHGYMPVAFLIY